MIARGRIVLAVDASVIYGFLRTCERDTTAEEIAREGDEELAAARLIVALAAAGEWQLATSALQLEQVCRLLAERYSWDVLTPALMSVLGKAMRVLPVEESHVRAAVAAGGVDLSLAVLAECARGTSAVAVVTMGPLSREGPAGLVGDGRAGLGVPVMTAVGFFEELRRRYGVEYDEIAL